MSQLNHKLALLISSLFPVAFCFLPTIAAAQTITPDGTTPTTVTTSGLNHTITNGTAAGTNLFHSFRRFDIPTGGSANFNLVNTPAITTIFSRVTGGSVSKIDGAIRTLNSTNPVSLFLINPSGILFGPNASLNIGGSFIGTTANSIKFADGSEFSATNPLATPLLTVSVPIGLQMGSNPGSITVNGPGHRLTIESAFSPLDSSNNPLGLRVNPGATLGLIGGEIALAGGVLGAASGHIELGSVSQGTVGITTTSPRWRFDYGTIQQFGDIRLSQQSLADASGAPAGSIQLRGQNIRLLEGSVARLANLGGSGQGDLVVKADGSLDMRGLGNHGFPYSLVVSENFGSNPGSNLIISAQQLQLQEGAEIIAKNYGSGSGGNITVNVAHSIDVQGFSAVNPSLVSSIIPVTFGSGRSGDLTVWTGQLRIADGASVTNISVGTGQGGNTTVHARIGSEVVGENPIVLAPSALATSTFTRGNAGQLTITTPQLMVRDGGAIAAGTFGSGNSGDVVINVSERIEVVGKGAISGGPSQIAANARLLAPIFQQVFNLPPRPTGNSGNLMVNTPSLLVRDGAVVGVNHEGVGNAGNLQINAGTIALNKDGRISSDTFAGNGGNIYLQANTLILRDGSRINSTAGGTGDGGNITINAPIIAGFENSDIVANAVRGRGGNIQITTQGIFGLKFRPQLTPGNDITASSQFGVNGTVQISTPGIDPDSGLVQLATDFIDPSQQISAGCAGNNGNSFIATGRGGVPVNPTIDMRSDRTWADARDLSTFRRHAASPSTQITASDPIIEANAIRRNPDGEIELVATQTTQAPHWQTCAQLTELKK
jgi:filamentous hemagglutinin family protein